MLFTNYLAILAMLSLNVLAVPRGFWYKKPTATDFVYPTMTITSTGFFYPSGTDTAKGVASYARQKRDAALAERGVMVTEKTVDIDCEKFSPTAYPTAGGMYYESAYPTATGLVRAKRDDVVAEKREPEPLEERKYGHEFHPHYGTEYKDALDYPPATATYTGAAFTATGGWTWPTLRRN